ncbi:MAG TPA: biotin/lipoyl-containing protein [Lacunisphaera sp.]
MKTLRVTVDGKIFNVTVEMLDEPSVAASPARPAAVTAPAPEAPRVVPPATPAPAQAVKPGGTAGEVLSPLSGKIVSIDVKVGQDVEEGAQVATIEAMKMNTYVFAPKSGKVTAIIAAAGTAIDEGLPLLVIG